MIHYFNPNNRPDASCAIRQSGIAPNWLEEDIRPREGNQTRGTPVKAGANLQHLLACGPAVIYSCAPAGDYRTTFISENVRTLLGYEVAEFLCNPKFWINHLHPEDMGSVFGHLARLPGNTCCSVEYRFLHRDGTYHWLRDELRLVCTEDGSPQEIVGHRIDITGRQEGAEELKRAYEELGIQVEARTEELKIKARHLEEANSALRVLLRQGEEYKKELDETIVSNLRTLVDPCIQKLRKSGLNEDQMAYLNLMEAHLQELVSPFVKSLSNKHMGLTQMELKVASLVRGGKMTSEIARMLNISENAVTFHRHNLRAKFGLKDKKINLASYLQSLDI